jgi:hypothetical protein
MTLATHEFIRRFLIHVLPAGFHRIRHMQLKIIVFLQTFGRNPRLSPETAAGRFWRGLWCPQARKTRQRGSLPACRGRNNASWGSTGAGLGRHAARRAAQKRLRSRGKPDSPG